MSSTILITGGAGFIGFSLSEKLIKDKNNVVLVDNLNDYYDVKLKQDRLSSLGRPHFMRLDVADHASVAELFEKNSIDTVVHLAAQAGVRYAKQNPEAYIHSNVDGFFTIINAAAKYGVKKFIYASSSSVYGANTTLPFKEGDVCRTPMSLYAATKLANESIASAYFYTHGLASVGLRFFNVYGPWGRPDMAYYKWAEALTQGKEIELRDNGHMYRDMTYIEDVVTVITKFIFEYNWNKSSEVYNVGNRDPVKILDVLNYLQDELHIKNANVVSVKKGSEEPIKTFADTQKLKAAIDFVPDTHYTAGLKAFIGWYNAYVGRMDEADKKYNTVPASHKKAHK